MISQAEKIALCTDELNRQAKEIGHPDPSTDRVKNKLDSVRAKAKKLYQDVRRNTSTGALMENDFDLEVSKLALRLLSA